MNLRLILSVCGQMINILGFLMLTPILVALIYQESWLNIWSFFAPSLFCILLGQHLSKTGYDAEDMHAVEGFVVVAISWLLMSFFGSFPYLISGVLNDFPDAFFETASGFSTTGATIFPDLEIVDHSILFWRSLTQYMGGMGVLVFVLAILPSGKSESIYIMKAEVPGTGFGKLKSRVSSSARVLYRFYLLLTFITLILLLLGGVPVFDATLLAFGSAATGGFSSVNASIAHYGSLYINMVIAFSMLAFSVNFNLYYLFLRKQFHAIQKNEELKWFVGIIVLATILISLNLYLNDYGLANALPDSFFSVSSVISTTAFVTEDFGAWPIFSRMVLLTLMFTGGMSGSTAGGLKISRVAVLIKMAIAEVRRVAYPNRVVSVHFEGYAQKEVFLKGVAHYFIIYVLFFVFSLIIVSLEVPEFISSFSMVAAMINNIGTGFGIVGPSYNYSGFSGPLKLFLSFIMLAGRLELYPFLILISSDAWKRSFK